MANDNTFEMRYRLFLFLQVPAGVIMIWERGTGLYQTVYGGYLGLAYIRQSMGLSWTGLYHVELCGNAGLGYIRLSYVGMLDWVISG